MVPVVVGVQLVAGADSVDEVGKYPRFDIEVVENIQVLEDHGHTLNLRGRKKNAEQKKRDTSTTKALYQLKVCWQDEGLTVRANR